MSRSYKKNPCCTDNGKHTTYEKRRANKVVRRSIEDIPNGKTYKRFFCSWNIRDYSFRYTANEAREDYNKEENMPWMREYVDADDYVNKFWRKWYKSK